MDATGPVVVVAGAGALPGLVLDALAKAGRPARLLALSGFCDRALVRRADAVMSLLDVSGILARLAAWRPSAVTLAGGVTRPSPAALANGAAAWRNRAQIAEVFARGDDHLLRGVIALLEEEGHRVVGVHELAPDLLAPAGVLGAVRPGPDHARAIMTGFACLAVLSPFDVGQACVAVEGRILAIEGPEGTDRMMSRVRPRFSLLGGRGKAPGGVLCKAAKIGQEMRVDLAASGVRTVENAAKAGLAGIALGAGVTLAIDRPGMIATADRLGLFLVGVDPDNPEIPS